MARIDRNLLQALLQLQLPRLEVLVQLRLERAQPLLRLQLLPLRRNESLVLLAHLLLQVLALLHLLAAQFLAEGGRQLPLEGLESSRVARGVLLKRPQRRARLLLLRGVARCGARTSAQLGRLLLRLGGGAPLRHVVLLERAQQVRHRLVDLVELSLQLVGELLASLDLPRERRHLRLGAQPRSTQIDVPARQRALAAHLVAVEGDAIEVVRLGVAGPDLEAAHDEALAEHLHHRRAHVGVELELREHRDGVLRLRVVRVSAWIQSVERHEGHAPSVRLLQLAEHQRCRLVRVHDHLEELVRRRDFHRRVELLVDREELDEHAVDAADALLCGDALDGAHRLPLRARHRLAHHARRLLEVRLAARQLLAHLLLLAPQLLPLLRHFVALLPQPRALVLGVAFLLPMAQQQHLAALLRHGRDGGLVLRLLQLLLERGGARRVRLEQLAHGAHLLLEVLVARRLGLELRRARLLRVEGLQRRLALLHLRAEPLRLLRRRIELGARLLELPLHLRDLRRDALEVGARARLARAARVAVRRLLAHLHLKTRLLGEQPLVVLGERFALVLQRGELRRCRLELALGVFAVLLGLLLARLHLRRALALLLAPRVHPVELGLGLALLLVVVRVLRALALLVELLVEGELLFLRVELLQPPVDVLKQLADLLAPRRRFRHDLQALLAPLAVRARARDLLEQLEPLLVLHQRERVHFALRYDVVRVGAREAGALEQVHHLVLCHVLAVEKVLVFFQPNRSLEHYFLALDGQSAIGIVEVDLHVCRHDMSARSLV
mmetsp:Transcript_22373/g.51523  ORF Transcript_22373/g.51523 Transcript_22373/m.51523 type:complete len:783 (-) Transcript_22373:293-2641(-)